MVCTTQNNHFVVVAPNLLYYFIKTNLSIRIGLSQVGRNWPAAGGQTFLALVGSPPRRRCRRRPPRRTSSGSRCCAGD